MLFFKFFYLFFLQRTEKSSNREGPTMIMFNLVFVLHVSILAPYRCGNQRNLCSGMNVVLPCVMLSVAAILYF